LTDGSGDALCRQNAQASTTVVRKNASAGVQSLRSIPVGAFDDDKARFDNLAIAFTELA